MHQATMCRLVPTHYTLMKAKYKSKFKATVCISGAESQNLYGDDLENLKGHAIKLLTQYEPGVRGLQPTAVLLFSRVMSSDAVDYEVEWKKVATVYYTAHKDDQLEWKRRGVSRAQQRKDIAQDPILVVKDTELDAAEAQEREDDEQEEAGQIKTEKQALGAFLTVEDFQGSQPRIYYSYPQRPSWKVSGTGRATVDIRVRKDGGLDFRAQEIPESCRGTKDVFFSIPPEVVVKLKELLRA
jgi:hypothetical protein